MAIPLRSGEDARRPLRRPDRSEKSGGDGQRRSRLACGKYRPSDHRRLAPRSSRVFDRYIPPLHPLQGGAGTSTNMAANELIANLALKRMGKPFGAYETISPLATRQPLPIHQRPYPTAVRIAVMPQVLKKLHRSVETLLEALLARKGNAPRFLKIGQTDLQDAMPLARGSGMLSLGGKREPLALAAGQSRATG